MKYFVFIFSLLIGIGCFFVSFKMIRLYLKVRNWDKVEAKVESKKVELREKYSTRQSVAYAPRVKYLYTINGREYMGNKVSLEELVNGERGYRKNQAEKLLSKIPDKIMVYVNPKNHEESVIFCDGVTIYIIVFIIGIMSILIGLGSIIKLK